MADSGTTFEVDTRGRDHSFSAVEAVFREHHDYVWRTLYHLGVPPSLVDDALQDVFLVVHRRLATFDHKGSLKSWLYGIARRVASEYRRGTRAGTKHLRLVRDLESHEAGNHQLPRISAAQLVRRFLDHLDENKRRVFLLAEVEGMTAAEIAEVTGINVNTVYARLRAARSKFEKAVSRYEARQKREETCNG